MAFLLYSRQYAKYQHCVGMGSVSIILQMSPSLLLAFLFLLSKQKEVVWLSRVVVENQLSSSLHEVYSLKGGTHFLPEKRSVYGPKLKAFHHIAFQHFSLLLKRRERIRFGDTTSNGVFTFDGLKEKSLYVLVTEMLSHNVSWLFSSHRQGFIYSTDSGPWSRWTSRSQEVIWGSWQFPVMVPFFWWLVSIAGPLKPWILSGWHLAAFPPLPGSAWHYRKVRQWS